MKKLLVTSVALAALVVPASTGASASGFKIDDIPGYIFVHRPDVGLTVCVPGDGEQIETVGAAVLDAETGQIAFRTASLDVTGQVELVDPERFIKAANGEVLTLDAADLVTALAAIDTVVQKAVVVAGREIDVLTIAKESAIAVHEESLLTLTRIDNGFVLAATTGLPVPDMPKMAHVESPVPA